MSEEAGTEEGTAPEENYILNPIEVNAVDEETGQPVLDDDGNPVREVVSATPEVVYIETEPATSAEAEEVTEEEPVEEEPSY